jgi:hypothetical protein
MIDLSTARFKANDRVMIKNVKGSRVITTKAGKSSELKYAVELVGEIATVAEVYINSNKPDVNGPRDVPGFEWIEYAVRMIDESLISFRYHELVKI